MSEWGNKDYANNVPKYLGTGLANSYFSNSEVYLVNDARLANATFGSDNGVAHQGWLKITQGTGYVKDILVSNVSMNLTYTSAYLDITGSNTAAANARIAVTGGNNVIVAVFTGGAGYADIPTVTAQGGGNNDTLIFTVTPGGRMGRVQAETLVALSDPQVTDSNTGLPYFTGV